MSSIVGNLMESYNNSETTGFVQNLLKYDLVVGLAFLFQI